MEDIKIYGKLVNDTPSAIVADSTQIAYGDSTQSAINQQLISDITDEAAAREEGDNALQESISNEVLDREADVQNLTEIITQLEAKQVMAISLDQTTGILSLHYDDNSNVTNATLGEDGKLKLTYEI